MLQWFERVNTEALDHILSKLLRAISTIGNSDTTGDRLKKIMELACLGNDLDTKRFLQVQIHLTHGREGGHRMRELSHRQAADDGHRRRM